MRPRRSVPAKLQDGELRQDRFEQELVQVRASIAAVNKAISRTAGTAIVVALIGAAGVLGAEVIKNPPNATPEATTVCVDARENVKRAWELGARSARALDAANPDERIDAMCGSELEIAEEMLGADLIDR